MERMVFNLKRQEVPVPQEGSPRVLIAYLGDQAKAEALSLASQLRNKGIGAILAPAGKSLRAQMRFANSLGTPYTLILGEDEISRGALVLRDMAKGEQREVLIQGVAEELSL
jgi:histidyl-tRNA synthetase